VLVEYTFYAPDGSSVVVVTPGLADDFADRSTAQAMSVAYRVALLQLFHLPTHSKEPEETGEETMKQREGSGTAPKAPKAVAAAQQRQAPTAPTAASNVTKLQSQAAVLGKKLN